MRAKFLIAGVLAAGAVAGGAAYLLLLPTKPPVSALSERPAPPPAPAPAAAPVAVPPAAVPMDCLLPGPPPVPPNGATASDADMKLGHDVIQAYVVQLEAYQTCRNTQADRAPLGTSEQRKQIWIEQGNEAVDQAHAIADAFSAQLKVFKQRHP